jgi:hypothetical protein
MNASNVPTTNTKREGNMVPKDRFIASISRVAVCDAKLLLCNELREELGIVLSVSHENNRHRGTDGIRSVFAGVDNHWGVVSFASPFVLGERVAGIGASSGVCAYQKRLSREERSWRTHARARDEYWQRVERARCCDLIVTRRDTLSSDFETNRPRTLSYFYCSDKIINSKANLYGSQSQSEKVSITHQKVSVTHRQDENIPSPQALDLII